MDSFRRSRMQPNPAFSTFPDSPHYGVHDQEYSCLDACCSPAPTAAGRYVDAVNRLRRARGLSGPMQVMIPDLNDRDLVRIAKHTEQEADQAKRTGR